MQDALVPGEYAIAVGHPGNLENIVTMGLVSGFVRPVAGLDTYRHVYVVYAGMHESSMEKKHCVI